MEGVTRYESVTCYKRITGYESLLLTHKIDGISAGKPRKILRVMVMRCAMLEEVRVKEGLYRSRSRDGR